MATSSRASMLSLLLLASAITSNAALTYKGCFSSAQTLSDVGSYQYQSKGYCGPLCLGKNKAVAGLSNGSDCWCGDQLPPANTLVDDSMCSTPCNGFGDEKCGGSGFYTVYLTGLSNDVTNASPVDTSSGSSSSSPSSSASAAAAANSPSVVTSVSPANTVVVTVSASASNTAAANTGSGTSVAGVAAGVVVGIVAIAAIIGGVFFWLRHRRRQQAEKDYQRSAQVADFMRGGNAGERKAPATGYSQMSDSRLDPEAGRRNSVGSMADEHDYSRRILRVANPDSQH